MSSYSRFTITSNMNVVGGIYGILSGIVVGGLVGFGAGMGASALGRALNTQSFENVDATQVAANTAVVAAASLGIIGAMA
jgi:hypothetical protein